MRSLPKFAVLAALLGTGTAIFAAPEAAQTPPASVSEMAAKSAAMKSQIDEDGRYLLHLREIAKKRKDVIKLACVNDKLVQIKAQQNLADNTNTQLQASLQNNSDERMTLFADLQRQSQTIANLRQEAQACIGEDELFKQESGVVVEHPEIIDEPPVGPPNLDVEPPGYASPFH